MVKFHIQHFSIGNLAALRPALCHSLGSFSLTELRGWSEIAAFDPVFNTFNHQTTLSWTPYFGMNFWINDNWHIHDH